MQCANAAEPLAPTGIPDAGATWRPLPARGLPEATPQQAARSLAVSRLRHLPRGATLVTHARGMDTDNQIFVNKHRQWSIWYADPGPMYLKYVKQDYYIRWQAYRRLKAGGTAVDTFGRGWGCVG